MNGVERYLFQTAWSAGRGERGASERIVIGLLVLERSRSGGAGATGSTTTLCSPIEYASALSAVARPGTESRGDGPCGAPGMHTPSTSVSSCVEGAAYTDETSARGVEVRYPEIGLSLRCLEEYVLLSSGSSASPPPE